MDRLDFIYLNIPKGSFNTIIENIILYVCLQDFHSAVLFHYLISLYSVNFNMYLLNDKSQMTVLSQNKITIFKNCAV